MPLKENAKEMQRPNSVISLGSSFSSGTSHSSRSTSSNSSISNARNTITLNNELNMITSPLKAVCIPKKYQRSTTLTSQVSMGELFDFSVFLFLLCFRKLLTFYFIHFSINQKVELLQTSRQLTMKHNHSTIHFMGHSKERIFIRI